MKKVAVIGAGMAGAGAAWKLRKAGCKVEVFEKEAWPGGRTRTHRGEGYQVNTGAGFFTNFYPRFRRMLEEMDLEGEVIENPKVVTLATPERRYDYRLDSVLSFLRLPWLGVGDKLRLLRLTLGLSLRKKRLDLADPATLIRYDSASVAEFARAKVGERAYQYLVRSAIEPYWYFSCEEASAGLLAGLQAHAATARFFTLREGMDGLARKMMQAQHVRYSATALRIEPRHNATGTRFLLHLAGEAAPAGEYDALVIATTAPVAKTLLDSAGPGPWGGMSGFLGTQRYAANVNAYFLVPEEILKDFSPQTSPCGPGAHPMAAVALHGSRIDRHQHPGKAMLGVWLSDTASRAWMDRPEGETAAFMWEEVRKYRPDFPATTPPCLNMNRRTEAIPLHAPGRYTQAMDLWKAQRPPIALAGDYLSTATMEGALNSGYMAAEILIKSWN